MSYDNIISDCSDKGNKLADIIQRIKISELKEIVGDTIYQRGVGYTDGIINIEAKNINYIAAYVQGNYGDYEVNIRLKNNILSGNCECKYFEDSGLCKHIVGVILYAQANLKEIFLDAKDGEIVEDEEMLEEICDILKETNFEKISNYSLVEMKEILATLRVIYETKYPNPAEKIIEKVSEKQTIIPPKKTMLSAEEIERCTKKLKNVVDDFNRLMAFDGVPSNFETKLLKRLKPLEELVEKGFAVKVCDELIYIISAIGEAYENGELDGYDDYGYDNYDDDDGGSGEFDGSDFSKFIVNQISKLNEQELFDWFVKYIKIKYQSDFYNIISEKKKAFFSEKENIDILIEYSFWLLDTNNYSDKHSELYNYYIEIKDNITQGQKKDFLSKIFISDARYLKEFIEFFDINTEIKEIRGIYECFLESSDLTRVNKDVLEKYTQLFNTEEDAHLLVDFLEKIINKDSNPAKRIKLPPFSTALFLAYLKALQKTKDFEMIAVFCEEYFVSVEFKTIDFYFLEAYLLALIGKDSQENIKIFFDKITDKNVYSLKVDNYINLKKMLPDYDTKIQNIVSKQLKSLDYAIYLENTKQMDLYYETVVNNSAAIKSQNPYQADEFLDAFFKKKIVREKYREETKDYYKNVILIAEKDVSKDAYIKICEALLSLKEMDSGAAFALASKLRVLYTRRKNFIIELNKSGF